MNDMCGIKKTHWANALSGREVIAALVKIIGRCPMLKLMPFQDNLILQFDKK